MVIFRPLESGSLSDTAMWDFSGKAYTSIHGLGEDDTARGSPAEKVEDRGLEPRSGIQDPRILDRFEGGGQIYSSSPFLLLPPHFKF